MNFENLTEIRGQLAIPQHSGKPRWPHPSFFSFLRFHRSKRLEKIPQLIKLPLVCLSKKKKKMKGKMGGENGGEKGYGYGHIFKNLH